MAKADRSSTRVPKYIVPRAMVAACMDARSHLDRAPGQVPADGVRVVARERPTASRRRSGAQSTGPPIAPVAVQPRPPDRAVIEAFQTFVASLPEVVSYFVMSGSDDFLLHVAVADNDQLSAFILDRLTQRREIVHVRTSVIFSHVRRPVVVPLRSGEDS
ncbi:Lrp/AsnC ligand binding domain-containing protein [Actinocatenispora rupis]|uniref:Lrp/AsnC ligand binding domain-containing protein n=1 Tax=Actinocatenispora rupis TaxID=519421 RepID=UPI0027E40FA9|nr:Lrp/AsnC ligand binding domain-containing protein [Actinocatenispora rupis]